MRTEGSGHLVIQQEELTVPGVDDGAQHPSEEEDESWWTHTKQSHKALPRNLIAAFNRCRTMKVKVPETCSPHRWCMLTDETEYTMSDDAVEGRRQTLD